MDISVSHLNNRLSLQLPQELPLGLVFVVGTIHFAGGEPFMETVAHGRYRHIHFELLDSGYQLRCILVVRSVMEVDVERGSRVRIGGHLRFDAQRADYYILARDLERVDEDLIGDSDQVESSPEEIAALLADVPEQRHGSRIPEDLPKWVKKLAPESYQGDDSNGETNGAENGEEDNGRQDESLVSSISALLDQPDDVELTPEMIEEHDLGGNGRFAQELTNPYEAIEELEATNLSRQRIAPTQEKDQDWLLWILFICLFLLVMIFLIVIFS